MLAIILLLFAFSLALSVTMTPVVRVVAIRGRFVDLPDNNRKVHRKPMPRIGGVAIFAAYFGSCLALASLAPHLQFARSAQLGTVTSVAPAAVLIFLVGLLDDLIGLNPWHKLAAEIVAGFLVISAGISFGGAPMLAAHPMIGAFCTIVWLVLCTNAVNLIDGLDGLAAGIALMATAAAFVASLFYGSFSLTIAAAPLAGALLGFLIFNFNPASIFLGDSGSLFIGFLLGCFGIMWSEHAATLPKMAAPLVALAVPLTDTTLAIVRRFLRAQPIFSPDRSHVHHRLLAHGLSHKRAVLVLYIAAAIAGAFSVCLILAGTFWEPIIILAFAAGLWFVIQRLGYAELDAARCILTRTAFHREVNAQLAVRSFEHRLAAASTPTECWAVIQDASHDFGFRPIHMQLGGQIFTDEGDSGLESFWRLRMPISQNDWIELFHELGPVSHASAVVSFVETIRKVLGGKHAILAPQPAPLAASAGAYRGAASNLQRV